MGILVKHVLKHPSGLRSFRRAFPKGLWPITGREHKVPLGREGSPGFLARHEAASVEYDRRKSKAERRLSEDFDVLDRPFVAFLAEKFRISLLQEDEEARWDATDLELYLRIRADLDSRGLPFSSRWEGIENQRWAIKTRENLDFMLPIYRQLRAGGDLDGIERMWADEVADWVEACGYVVNLNERDAFRQLCRAINDAAISAGEDQLRRLEGHDVPTPPEPPAFEVAAVQSLHSQSASIPVLSTFDAYAAAQGMTPGVRKEWRNYMQRLIEFLGHDDLATLSAADLRRWRDHLIAEPTKGGKPRSRVTVRDKYITSVRAMLAWAVEEQMLAANVASDVTVRVEKAVKLRERNFTKEEAAAILAATLLPVEGRLANGYVLARRWIPWLCAYTGARVNELSQLRGQDVTQIDGQWTIRITPEAGTVKAKEARTVPIHSHVIEQGFIGAIADLGDGPLFYDPSKQRVRADSNRHFKKVGERLAEWVRKDVGITDPGIKPNHAWRNTFKTIALSAGVQERISDAITGHAPLRVGRKYESVPLFTMVEAINSIPRYSIPDNCSS